MDEPTEDIRSIEPGEVTVKATITHKYAHRIRNGNLMTDVVIADKTGATKAVWFSRQPKDELVVGSEYIFSGNYELKYGRLALQSPNYKTTGLRPSAHELAESPLILPVRNYGTKKSKSAQWPEWTGAAIGWAVILVVVGIVWLSSKHSQVPTTSPDPTTTTTTQQPTSNTTPAATSNSIPEISSPTQADANAKCIDVTSYDYDWNDDVLCTRPNGSQFYTNYAGGQTADPTFEK